MSRTHAHAARSQAGITLLEVLVAIFVMGVGLLALLTLFPLGALELAQAIKDDRTAAIAASAQALGQAGTDLVSKTTTYVLTSLANGSADPQVAAELREEYEDLGVQAAQIEMDLQELRAAFPPRQIEPHLARLLAQIRAIEHRIDTIIRLLARVEKL